MWKLKFCANDRQETAFGKTAASSEVSPHSFKERGEQDGKQTGHLRHIFHKYLQERKGCSTIARELREAGILSSKGNCLWLVP